MKIHKEGHRILSVLFIVLVFFNIFYYLFYKKDDWVSYLVTGLSILLYLNVLHFFRSPKRKILKDENGIFAPADGTIVAIEEVEEKLYFNETRLQVSIFMSPLNTHMNLYPISGVVDFVKHEQGMHWVAWIPKSSRDNERTSIVITHKNGVSIMVRQIAGAVARRIVTYCKPNFKVAQGEELGFIKFGSRVDMFLPKEMKINVELDQKVKANSSIIASFKEQ